MQKRPSEFQEWISHWQEHNGGLWSALVLHAAVLFIPSLYFMPTETSRSFGPIDTTVSFSDGDDEVEMTLPLEAESLVEEIEEETEEEKIEEEEIVDEEPPPEEPVAEQTENGVDEPIENPTGGTGEGISAAEMAARRQERGGNTGLLTITLGWHSTDDLDLQLIAPDGSKTYHGNHRTRCGHLDVDANVGGGYRAQQSLTNTPLENIYGNELLPGVYRVIIHFYRRRNQDAVPFSVGIWIKDHDSRIYHDVFKQNTFFLYAFEIHEDASVTWLDVERVETETRMQAVRQMTDQDRLAERLYQRAQSSVRRGDLTKARSTLKKIVADYSGTSAIRKAAQLLANVESRLKRRSR